MSRIGKLPIKISDKVNVHLKDGLLKIKGVKGEVVQQIHPRVKVEVKKDVITLSVKDPELKEDRALWGLFRAIINNMVKGAENGFEKKLEIHGVGYKAQVSGKKLVLNLGFSHPVEFTIPEGIEIKVEKNMITISGPDKQKVGQVAAEIRGIRKPEPYKGKGIRYLDEVVRKKAGKAAKSAGEAKG